MQVTERCKKPWKTTKQGREDVSVEQEVVLKRPMNSAALTSDAGETRCEDLVKLDKHKE